MLIRQISLIYLRHYPFLQLSVCANSAYWEPLLKVPKLLPLFYPLANTIPFLLVPLPPMVYPGLPPPHCQRTLANHLLILLFYFLSLFSSFLLPPLPQPIYSLKLSRWINTGKITKVNRTEMNDKYKLCIRLVERGVVARGEEIGGWGIRVEERGREREKL